MYLFFDFQNILFGKKISVLDLGTASGVLLISILSNLKNLPWYGVGVDVNKNALALARENAIDIIDPGLLSQNEITFKEHSYSELKELNGILSASSKFFVYYFFSRSNLPYTNHYYYILL